MACTVTLPFTGPNINGTKKSSMHIIEILVLFSVITSMTNFNCANVGDYVVKIYFLFFHVTDQCGMQQAWCLHYLNLFTFCKAKTI
jgi:hypothetical protein